MVAAPVYTPSSAQYASICYLSFEDGHSNKNEEVSHLRLPKD